MCWCGERGLDGRAARLYRNLVGHEQLVPESANRDRVHGRVVVTVDTGRDALAGRPAGAAVTERAELDCVLVEEE